MFYFPASLGDCVGLEKGQRVRDHNTLREKRKPPGLLTVFTKKATNL